MEDFSNRILALTGSASNDGANVTVVKHSLILELCNIILSEPIRCFLYEIMETTVLHPLFLGL